MGGQREMKSCARSLVGHSPQPAAMRLHNGAADGQPHAATLRLGGKERRKDLIHLLHCQPHARVTDRALELTVLPFPEATQRLLGDAAQRRFPCVEPIASRPYRAGVVLDNCGYAGGML